MKHHVLRSTEEDLARADAAWVAELVKAFGTDQVDAMAACVTGQGEPGTELRIAYEARQAALVKWRAARKLD